MKKEDLTNEILQYMKDYDHYGYLDCYDSDIEAYDNIYSCLDLHKDRTGMLVFFEEELDHFSRYEDLRDEYVLGQFKRACDLAIKLNCHTHDLLDKQKEQDKEI